MKGFRKISVNCNLLRLSSEFIKQTKNFGFNYINLPLTINKELIDEETINNKEMFFLDEKNILRPEFTPLANQFFIENNIKTSPFKLSYEGDVFRKERPQKMRFRQFKQLGCEIFNFINITETLELFFLLNSFLKKNIKNFYIKINSIGNKETQNKYINYLKKELKTENLSEKSKRILQTEKSSRILRIFESKNEKDVKEFLNLKSILYFLTNEEKNNLNIVIKFLKEMKIPFKIDKFLVRGLSYYRGIVFEVYTDSTPYQAICGGGEFLSTNGKKCIGFSIGAERLNSIINSSKTENDRIINIIPSENNLNKIIKIFKFIEDKKIEKFIIKYRGSINKRKMSSLGNNLII